MIERSPRAPVSRARPFSATAVSESSENTSSMPSKEKKRWNCFTSALRGSTRIETRSSRVSWCTADITGRRPMNSGISPYSIRSSGQAVLEHFARVALGLGLDRRREAHPFVPDPRSITLSRLANAPPQMNRTLVVSIVRNSWWGCLRPPCGGTEAWVPSRIFSSACCTPSPGDVPGDRRVVGLARDLVDLVDVDDARLGLLDVVVGGLDQLQQDVLDVLADIPGLRQGGRIGDRERHVQDPRQRLGQQRLAAAGGTEQQDVRLLQLDVGLAGHHHLHALVVVVDGHRQRALGWILADHVLVQHVVDLTRLGQVLEIERRRSRELLVDDLVAEVDALVADVHAGTGDQLLDLSLGLAAEAAQELLVGVCWSGHGFRSEPPLGDRS